MRERNAFLEAGGAGRVLDERQAIARDFALRDFPMHVGCRCVADANQLRTIIERYILQQLLWERIVDQYDPGIKVAGHSCQSGAILGRLNLEIGVRENCRHRGYH